MRASLEETILQSLSSKLLTIYEIEYPAALRLLEVVAPFVCSTNFLAKQLASLLKRNPQSEKEIALTAHLIAVLAKVNPPTPGLSEFAEVFFDQQLKRSFQSYELKQCTIEKLLEALLELCVRETLKKQIILKFKAAAAQSNEALSLLIKTILYPLLRLKTVFLAEEVTPFLNELYQKGHCYEREEVMKNIAEMTTLDHSAIKLLENGIKDQSNTVKTASVYALSRHHFSSETIPSSLIRLIFSNKNEALTFNAIQLLSQYPINSRCASLLLNEIAAKKNPEVNANFIRKMWSIYAAIGQADPADLAMTKIWNNFTEELLVLQKEENEKRHETRGLGARLMLSAFRIREFSILGIAYRLNHPLNEYTASTRLIALLRDKETFLECRTLFMECLDRLLTHLIEKRYSVNYTPIQTFILSLVNFHHQVNAFYQSSLLGLPGYDDLPSYRIHFCYSDRHKPLQQHLAIRLQLTEVAQQIIARLSLDAWRLANSAICHLLEIITDIQPLCGRLSCRAEIISFIKNSLLIDDTLFFADKVAALVKIRVFDKDDAALIIQRLSSINKSDPLRLINEKTFFNIFAEYFESIDEKSIESLAALLDHPQQRVRETSAEILVRLSVRKIARISSLLRHMLWENKINWSVAIGQWLRINPTETHERSPASQSTALRLWSTAEKRKADSCQAKEDVPTPKRTFTS